MRITILKAVSVGLMLLVLGGVRSTFSTDANSAPAEKTFDAPHGLKVSIKMIGPYSDPADLQMICLFKHKATGDTYQSAAKDTDEHLHGILSALRNRGEFAGELGETFLFTPPNGSIPAKRFMVIGLGEEKDLSLDSLRVVGRIAVLDVGQGDRVFVEQMLSAYDTEKRLQAQALAPDFSIEDLVIEAGPTFFDSAVKQVSEGIESMAAEIVKRNSAPYSSAKMQ